MAEILIEACETCHGTGIVERPICRGGSDHAGHDCNGSVCGSIEADCPDCGDPFGLSEFDAEGI